jgi:plastocyanin
MRSDHHKTKVVLLAALSLVATGLCSAPADVNIPEARLIEMAPYLGYLEAHKDVREPARLLGGPIRVIVMQEEGGVHVALPDYRRLDARVFGTPELPRAYAGTPIMTGVPPEMRGVENGQYTKLKVKSPFGHANMVLGEGRYSLDALDVTATDAATTEDSVKMEASWKDKEGNTYTVRCSKVAPHGVEYPSFGGVLTNHILHGSSRIGTPLMPTAFVYVAFWGMGETLKNGESMDSDRIVHCMLTEFVRTTDYELAFDDQITPTKVQMHLIVPPVIVKEGKFESKPLKTGFMLENGEELPFWHVMFANLIVSSERPPAAPPAAGPAAALEAGASETNPDYILGRPSLTKKRYVVEMTNSLTFYPERLTIYAGSTVEWKNVSELVHTVTDNPELALYKNDASYPAGAKPFQSPNILPGQTYSQTFNIVGSYKYFCTLHEAEGMKGIIIVR